MTAEELRLTLNQIGYNRAGIREADGNLTVLVPLTLDPLLLYGEHKAALIGAGIPILWGGLDMQKSMYWFAIKVEVAV